MKKKKKKIALYHLMREQDTLVAPRLWAEEGVERSNLKEGEPTPPFRKLLSGDTDSVPCRSAYGASPR